jgi:HlyD family secretion protein
LSLADEGNRPDTIEAQRLEVARSKAVLAMARTQMADTIVSIPQQGVVLTKNFEKGEFVNAGSAIATVGDLQDCWVKIYVPSTQLGLIKIGQPALIKIDSYPGKTFSGEIKEISQNAEFTPRQSLTQNERANMVYAVKVQINNTEDVLKPGMPADVVIK